MFRLAFTTLGMLAGLITGCTKEGPQKLGSKQQYALFAKPVEIGSSESEKSCGDLGNGWRNSYFEEWTKSDPIATPPTKVPIFAGDQGDGGIVVYDPNTKKVRGAKDKEQVAVLCHFDTNLQKTMNEDDAATKKKEESQAKRPKGNWQKMTENKSADEFAILGIGTREEALNICGLDYLPSVVRGTGSFQDLTPGMSFGILSTELINRETSRVRKAYQDKDVFARKKNVAAIEQLDESLAVPDRRGTGFWVYNGTTWPGSKVPMLSCANDRGQDLETRAYIICYSKGK